MQDLRRLARALHLDVDDAELARPRMDAAAAQVRTNAMFYQQHMTQADQGCDFDFLQTGAAMPVPDPDIF